MTWWDDFRKWLQQPFSADMTATHWFMFIGLLLVIMLAWGWLLGTFRRATGT